MSSTDVEKLYNEHIKPLPAAERLRLLAAIARDISPEARENCSTMELEGLGAEIWQGVDAQEYINALRQEWEERPAANEARRKWSEVAGIAPDMTQGADAQTRVTDERRAADAQREPQRTGER
jgi:hypothetical protein